jgi:hypothetical protein
LFDAKVAQATPCTKSITIHYDSQAEKGGRNRLFLLILLQMSERNHIERLKEAVVATFARTLDSPTDFDALSADVAKRTGENVSTSTLRRLYGYTKPAVVPRPSTLSVLARYVGYAGWSEFCQASEGQPTVASTPRRLWPWIALAGVVAVAAVIVALLISGRDGAQQPGRATVEPSSVVAPTTPPHRAMLEKYRRESLQFCNDVRAQRSSLDILAYKSLVDSLYIKYVFGYLQPTIAHEASATFGEEGELYSTEIFNTCRDICSTLLREIDWEEWKRAQGCAKN